MQPDARRGAARGWGGGRSRLGAVRALVLGACTAVALAAAPAASEIGIESALLPELRSDAADSQGADEEGIDWSYWASVNPDVIGWIEVPGTPVAGPLAQAPPDDPAFYLTHDAYRNESVQGCFYLDADCAEGLASSHCVVLGHNMADGSMFAPLRGYLDASYAAAHPTVVIRTPEGARTFTVAAARSIAAEERAKRTDFATAELLRAWLADQIARSPVVLDPGAADRAEQALTLVTCLPGGSRRTLVLGVQAADSA